MNQLLINRLKVGGTFVSAITLNYILCRWLSLAPGPTMVLGLFVGSSILLMSIAKWEIFE